ncbi:MAG: bifunctional diguanylate cyclase/phosphodiesterase, partial [Alphaproteobacteria bacterium]
MHMILTCVTDFHNEQLLLLAGVVCIVGIYASSAIAAHASRSEGVLRRKWGIVSIVAAGCTAWATHMIALLAYQPGMLAGFEPILTTISLFLVIGGIGAGVGLSIGQRARPRRFVAGVILGLGVTALHYVGQASYRVTGHVTWNWSFIAPSIFFSLGLFGLAMVVAGERNRSVRRFAGPLLFGAIVVLHLAGMTAVTLVYDPTVALPATAIAPETIAPIIAVVSFGLLALAFFGLRSALNAGRRRRARA